MPTGPIPAAVILFPSPQGIRGESRNDKKRRKQYCKKRRFSGKYGQ